ncbi:MAG: hypothetical protein R6X25_13130 [Candidatus Krumholzibacteriia bacterium]
MICGLRVDRLRRAVPTASPGADPGSRPRRPRRWVASWHLLLAIAIAPAAMAAGPVYWDYPERQGFGDAELEGAALDRHDRLIPGLYARELLAGEPEVVWCAAPDAGGGAFVGSGHAGEIWRIGPDGDASLHADLDGTEVFALLPYGGGLLAGCGPGGELEHVAADGTVTSWGKVPGGYVWALAEAGDGRVYLAAGSPAAVYRAVGPGSLEKVADLPATNALDLAVVGDGELLVATQGPGLVYRVSRDGTARVIFEAEQDEVRRLLRGPAGDWYALALAAGDRVRAGNGGISAVAAAAAAAAATGFDFMDIRPRADEPARAALLQLRDDGPVTTVWAGGIDLMTVAHAEGWGWLAAGAADEESGRARLLALEPPSGHRPLATWDGGDVLDLLVAGGDGRLDVLATLAHPGQVVRLRAGRGERCAAVSEPLDAGHAIRWGRLLWDGQGKIRWSVRGGARSTPDHTWTAWSDAWTERDHAIDLPAVRFLQWRVEFVDPQAGDRVESLTVSGHEPNLPPVIESLELQPPGQIKLGGLMPRGDNVTEVLPGGLRLEYSVGSQAANAAPLERVAAVRPVRTFSWQASDPNGDDLVYLLEYRRADASTWRPVGEPRTEPLGSWNTRTVPDGHYVVRLEASDRPSNPGATALRSYRETAPFLVDHTAPSVQDLKLSRSEKGFRLQMRAEDALSHLAGAVIELPDGRRERLEPVDLICDSRAERFDTEIVFPRTDSRPVALPWRVRVEVYDRPGNLAAAEAEVR